MTGFDYDPMGQLLRLTDDGQELAAYRGDILWSIDKSAKVRFSHRNKDVQALYREFLKAPLGEKSHHLLHTDHNGWKMPNEK